MVLCISDTVWSLFGQCVTTFTSECTVVNVAQLKKKKKRLLFPLLFSIVFFFQRNHPKWMFIPGVKRILEHVRWLPVN